MAEFVDLNVEQLIPVLEQLERSKLFTEDEIKQIVRKCKAYEYRLQKSVKSQDDFVKYSQYLIYFLALIKKRREQAKYWLKKAEIDKQISMKIESLMRRACHRFPADEKLWLSRIEFMKQKTANESVSKIFQDFLQFHGKNPNFWILAAKFEFESNGSAESARKLLQKSLRFHKNSPKLWLELFRFELLYVEKIRKRKEILDDKDGDEKISDAILDGKLAEIVYENAIKSVENPNALALKFYQIANRFDFAESLTKRIRERESSETVKIS